MKTKSKNRDFVAKHARSAGAGFHKAKSGKHALRSRQKAAFRRALKLLSD